MVQEIHGQSMLLEDYRFYAGSNHRIKNSKERPTKSPPISRYTAKEHRDGLHRIEDQKFSSLLAVPGWRGSSRRLAGRFAGRGASRGGRAWGWGLAQWPDSFESEDKDPELDAHMEEAELNRRREAAAEKSNEQGGNPPVDPSQHGMIGQIVGQFVKPPGEGIVPKATMTTAPSPVPKRDPKRMKKGVSDVTEDEDASAISAGSSEEYRRAQ
jgi:hypothetical protein